MLTTGQVFQQADIALLTRTTSMLQGELKKDGLKHLIILTDTEFIYRLKPRNGEPLETQGFTNIWNMGCVPLERILSVSKKVKHLKEDEDSFTVHYVISGTTGRNLEITKVKFKGPIDVCALFREKLRETVNERYPIRKYLVFVNPVSGKGKAHKIFTSKVEPILSMGGIMCQVKVTEWPHQVIELAQKCDLNDIQGVVVVGGDGMVSECITGLLMRAQAAARVDHNNPDSTIVPFHLPIGIIPAGSGDVIVENLHGTRDPITAAIRIVLGHQEKANVASIFKGRELCSYSSLLMGFGLIGDMMKDINQARWLGTARFQVVPLRNLMNRRILDLEIDYLTDKWQTINRTAYGVDVYVITWRPDNSKMVPCFGDNSLSVFITSKSKLSTHIEQLGKVQQHKSDCWDYEFVEEFKVQGFRIRLPSAPKLTTANGETILSHNYYLNNDGEVITIDKPQFEVRLHREAVSLFGNQNCDVGKSNQFVWYVQEQVTEL